MSLLTESMAAHSGLCRRFTPAVLLLPQHISVKRCAATGKFFPENPPARACFAVKTLPLNAKVEIEAIAVG